MNSPFQYTELVFCNLDKETIQMLTAKLWDINFTGFEEMPDGLKAYISVDNYKEDIVNEILGDFNISTFQKNIIEEQNWNAQWEQSFEPVLVNDFAGIRASFHAPIIGVKHEIIITPKMSFGTGHHATTYLMVELMQELDFHNKTVLDFGTGTGVLAILAEKLGALNVTAIDNDKWSIENTHENIAANHCVKINVFEANAIDETYRADIILANINLNILKENLDSLKISCGRNAVILFSGLLFSDKALFENLLEMKGFKIVKSVEKNGWVAIHAQYKELEA